VFGNVTRTATPTYTAPSLFDGFQEGENALLQQRCCFFIEVAEAAVRECGSLEEALEIAAAHPVGTALTVHASEQQRVSGTFAGLEPDGALRLRLDDGTVRVIHAGDVTLERS